MRSLSRTLTTIGVIAAVIFVGLLFGWLAARPPKTQAPLPVGVPTPPEAQVARTNAHVPATQLTSSTPSVVWDTNSAALAPEATGTNLIADWEERISTILSDNSELDAKARKLLALFPQLPADGQAETAQHISNLLDDKDFPAFGRYFTNPKMSEDVYEVLMADMMNRPNSMKMPLLLEVASNPDHPKAADAKETLGLLLEEDYGTNWTLWKEKIDEWQKANPD